MKSLIVTAALLTTVIAASSCSNAKSIAGEYLAAQKAGASGDAEIANGDSEGDAPVDDASAEGGAPEESTGGGEVKAPAAPAAPAIPVKPTGTTPGTTTPGTTTPGTTPPASTKPPASTTPGADPALALTYENVAAKVLTPSCTPCHGTMDNVPLDTYAKVKAAAAKIKGQAIDSAKMPVGGTLSAAQKDLLAKWISASTPEK